MLIKSRYSVRAPKIDFFAEGAAKEFTQSLKETGFAVLTKHNVDWSLIDKVFEEWRAFLNDLEKRCQDNEKNGGEYACEYSFDPALQDGFFPIKKAADIQTF